MEIIAKCAEGDGYSEDGVMLTRVKHKGAFLYAITDISHCSCFSAENPDETDHTLTHKALIRYAENKLDPDVPDTKTSNEYLLRLYEIILKNIKENPEWICEADYLRFFDRTLKAKIYLIDNDGNEEKVTDKMSGSKIDNLCKWLKQIHIYNVDNVDFIAKEVIFNSPSKSRFTFTFTVSTETEEEVNLPLEKLEKFYMDSKLFFRPYSSSKNKFKVKVIFDGKK